MPLSGRKLIILIALPALFFISSCGSDSDSSDAGTAESDPLAHGKSIYNDYCRLCHGADGQLGLNNASNLSQSTLSKEELEKVIKNGRNAMQPYKNILSEKEINNVTEYIMTFRQQ